MAEPHPIAVGESKAAKMLDLPKGEFLRLVKIGALPGPSNFGPYPRWSVARLQAVVNGTAARPSDEDFE